MDSQNCYNTCDFEEEEELEILEVEGFIKSYFLDVDLQKDDDCIKADFSDYIVSGGGTGGTNDYRKLINKPKINGTVLQEDYNEIDPTVPAWAKQQQKPNYNAAEVGAVDEDDVISLSEIDLMFLKIFGI